MVESLTFEEAQKLQQGDEICLSVDLGNGWTPARRLSVRSISTVSYIDRARYAAALTRLQNPDIGPHEVAFAHLRRKNLNDFPIDVVLIAADDPFRPIGRFREGTVTYAGVDYLPHMFYSRPPSRLAQ